EREADGWVVDLSLERGVLALLEIGQRVDGLTDGVHELDLAALLFDGRHFERPAETVGQGDGRFYTPGVGEVDVVERDRALVLGRSKRRIQREVGAGAGECGLGERHDAESGGVVATEGACGARRNGGRKNARHVDAGAAAGAELIDGL